jgi:hypothetical protein
MMEIEKVESPRTQYKTKRKVKKKQNQQVSEQVAIICWSVTRLYRRLVGDSFSWIFQIEV